ncbi:Glutamine--tRNA ligase [Armadillidium nasatum]|uniref:glutamine--tRNA ligase n=2 Tax=Armadillidium nasatum TaxID=96803 RepID=A0A5N5T627_9CRUS|nr:Glutamine--tRNA ligase [Armadillidium nasatum]
MLPLQKIDQEAKLTSAIKYIQDNASKEIDIQKFEESCGVGIVVSDDQIDEVVNTVLNENKDEILSLRYNFNFGPLIGQAKNLLKWADTRKVKETLDARILTLLGPKTKEDMEKPKKKIISDEQAKVSKPLKNEIKQNGPLNIGKPIALTMAEFLKTVNFHKPGENFKTDGYVICSKTHQLLEEHLKLTKGKIRTRFPPEPNGILHIGHAKAININFGYAKAHDGICILRYDDTNPEKEEEKFFVGIKDMVEWLGYKPAKITHSSDYFDQLYDWAIQLILKNAAYVCHQKPEDVRGYDPPPSPWRERPVEESLKLFQLMKMGYFDEGEATLRLKVTLEEGKVDPVAYRIKYVSHHRTKDKWCIYPTYDYTHCLCDSIEHITHSLCTKEFQNRRSSYYWLCNSLEIYCPVQWEYGRLNMLYAVVSKRKIAKLIDSGFVRDWDDPRLFTLTALRRRGFPPEAINNFCATLGLTGAQIAIHPDALEAAVRDVLNVTATRVMVVLEPLRIEILNFPFSSTHNVTVPNIPGIEEKGTHSVPFDKTIWIESSDFREQEEKGYRRLTNTQAVGLRHAGFILKVESIVRKNTGEIEHLNALIEPVTEENKPKAFIHWVSNPVSCEVCLYEKLFLHENPEDSVAVPGGFLSDINPNSMKTLPNALADVTVSNAKPYQKYQFERVGFFSVDPDSSPSRIVFNRTVGLKEDKGKI